MARLIFPETFEAQRTLLGLIRTKHIADGGASVLTALLTEKAINLNDDVTAGNTAATHDASQKLLMRAAENFVQQRDLKFDTVFDNTRAELQFLKSFLKPNFSRLGEWGATVDGAKGRIKYPAAFADRVTLVRAIKTKHDSFALPPPPTAPSPLTAYLTQNNISITADASAVNTAEFSQTFQLDARRDAELETQLRDNKWKLPLGHLHTIGDYLMKLYDGSQKKLGDYGFTVDHSPRKPKLRTTTLKLSSQITITSVVIGETLANTGDVLLHVYKGKTTIGTPIVVNPAEKLGMAQGFSTITVVNPSALVAGKFTVLRNR